MPIDELCTQLEVLYTGYCDHHDLTATDPTDDEFAQLMLQMVRQIWKDKSMPEGFINKDVVRAFASKLWTGVAKGYGQDMGTVNYDSPDFKMLASMQQNVWQFSAAKNYTQLRELTHALINTDGKLRTFAEFKEAAFKINNRHVKQQLKAEYELAVAGGQMGSKWVEFTESATLFPLLEFDAILDARTTELCNRLNGTILPVNHPFWDTYFPPNHWGCRSTVRQRRSGVETPSHNIPSADIPPIFRTNLAKTGLIFPAGSPYYIDLPQNINTLGLIRKEVRAIARSKFMGQQIVMEKIGGVEITSAGIDEIINQPHINKEFQLLLIHHLPEIMRNSTFVDDAPDYKKKAKHHFYYSVKGLDNFYLDVRERFDGKRELYSIVHKLKKICEPSP